MTERLSQEEWDEWVTKLPIGSRVKGRVLSVQLFGVFVDIGIDPRITILLEIIHFKMIEQCPDCRIEFPKDYPQVGSEIEARIVGYSEKPNTFRLTQLSHLEYSHSDWLKHRHDEV